VCIIVRSDNGILELAIDADFGYLAFLLTCSGVESQEVEEYGGGSCRDVSRALRGKRGTTWHRNDA